MGGLLKKSCAKNGEPVVEGCRVESFSMETASEAASNPCHCGRGGWTSIHGYGSIPIDTIFRGLFTSINPSYFDVNYRGTRF